MKSSNRLLVLLLVCVAGIAVGQEKEGATERLFSLLLEDKDGFRDLPFPVVVKAVTANKCFPH